MGKLLLSILPQKSFAKLNLLVCYGARTLQSNVNHIAPDKEINWRDSLAYRIFYTLAKENRIAEMTAFVTSMQYEGGKYFARHEDTSAVSEEKDKLAKIAYDMTQAADELYEQGKEKEARKLMLERLAFVEREIVPVDNRLSALKKIESYGKVVFSYNSVSNKCTIIMHHRQEPPRPLYSGALDPAPIVLEERAAMQAEADSSTNNNSLSMG